MKQTISLSERFDSFLGRLIDFSEGRVNIDPEELGDLFRRIWSLSKHHEAFASPVSDFYVLNKDPLSARQVLIDAALAQIDRGNHTLALEFFNKAHFILSDSTGTDWWESSSTISFGVRTIAKHISHTLKPQGTKTDARIRIAYIGRGLTEHSSVLMKLLKSFAAYHDTERFSPTFCFLDSPSMILSSTEGVAHLHEIIESGHSVIIPREDGNPLECAVDVAQQILSGGFDIVMFCAAMVDVYHQLLTHLNLAKVMGVFVQGPPAQYCSPIADFGIALTQHVQIDSPFDCHLVPVEFDVGHLQSTATLSSLNDTEPPPVLISGGRPAKLRSPEMWAVFRNLLNTIPDLRIRILGTSPDILGDLTLDIPADRIEFVPWGTDYLKGLEGGTAFVDTYPSGGGIILLEAVSLGMPVVTFKNDFDRVFDQRSWNPGSELLGDSEVVLERGDFTQLESILRRVILDRSFRDTMFTKQQAEVTANRSSLRRFVGRCEQVYETYSSSAVLSPPEISAT